MDSTDPSPIASVYVMSVCGGAFEQEESEMQNLNEIRRRVEREFLLFIRSSGLAHIPLTEVNLETRPLGTTRLHLNEEHVALRC